MQCDVALWLVVFGPSVRRCLFLPIWSLPSSGVCLASSALNMRIVAIVAVRLGGPGPMQTAHMQIFGSMQSRFELAISGFRDVPEVSRGHFRKVDKKPRRRVGSRAPGPVREAVSRIRLSPCWVLGRLGYVKQKLSSPDGGQRWPKLVPGGLWTAHRKLIENS